MNKGKILLALQVALATLFVVGILFSAALAVVTISASLVLYVLRHLKRESSHSKVFWWLLPVGMVLMVAATPVSYAESCGYLPIVTWWCISIPSWFGPFQYTLWSCFPVWLSVWTCPAPPTIPFAIRGSLGASSG